MSTRTADSDRPGWRTLARRREADRDFLARLLVATLDELRALADQHAAKHAPQWKRVAIARAIRRALR